MTQPRESRVNPQAFVNEEASATILRGHAIKLGTALLRSGNQALLNVTNNTKPIGIAYEDAAPGAMFTAEVAPGAIVPGKLGDTVTRGAYLTSEAGGGLVATTTTGHHAIAMALEDGGDGDVIECLFLGLFIVP